MQRLHALKCEGNNMIEQQFKNNAVMCSQIVILDVNN